MSFIESTSNQIIINATLTKRGRLLLASGVDNFLVTKFAVADDLVDYSIPLLLSILSETPEVYPILEPIVNGRLMMKSLLFTDVNMGVGSGRYILPMLAISGLNTTQANIIASNATLTYTPSTLDASLYYQVVFNSGQNAINLIFSVISADIINALVNRGATTTTNTLPSSTNSQTIAKCKSLSFRTKLVNLSKTFSITVTGLSTNASITYSFVVSPSSSALFTDVSATGVTSLV